MIGWIEQWNVGHLIDLSQIQVECAGKAIAFSCNLFDCRFRRVHWMLSTFDVQVQIAARHLPDKVLIRKCSKCRDFFFSLSLFFPPPFQRFNAKKNVRFFVNVIIFAYGELWMKFQTRLITEKSIWYLPGKNFGVYGRRFVVINLNVVC